MGLEEKGEAIAGDILDSGLSCQLHLQKIALGCSSGGCPVANIVVLDLTGGGTAVPIVRVGIITALAWHYVSIPTNCRTSSPYQIVLILTLSADQVGSRDVAILAAFNNRAIRSAD